MTEKLTDTVEKLNLSKKDKILMSLFPGMLFGFVPANLEQFEERIDCPTCVAIAEKMNTIFKMKMPCGWRYLFPWVRNKWKTQRYDLGDKILDEIVVLEKQDREHWGDEASRIISKEFVTAFIKQDDWVSQ